MFKITQTFKKEFTVLRGTKLRVFDYEDRVWFNAEIIDINLNNQKFLIKCEDGMEYWESQSELSDPKSYDFESKNK